MSDYKIEYSPAGSTIKQFHESNAFFRGIMGPIGSGKSSACVIEILRRAQLQQPGPDGVRRFRAAIIRNTYGELRTSVIKTWTQWCPMNFGKVNMDAPMIHHIQAPGFDMEILFLALDRDEDQRKLLSLELTMAWCNETKELSKAVVDTLTGRVGRYPSKIQGGCSWYGIIADTNPPDDQHWWFRFSEEETPKNWEFFKQPSGLLPEAENLSNLPKNYYQNLLAGKDPDWVKVYVGGEYGLLVEGKPVFPQYRDSIHCAIKSIEPVPNVGLIIGADFGLTPAAVIAQSLADGRIHIIDELVTDNTGVVRFAELLAQYVATNYSDHDVIACWADPAGNQRAFSDERTAIEIMSQYTKWRWKPAPGDNTITPRLESVRHALNRLIDGNPGLLISPKCRILRKGFVSGYHYKLPKSGTGVVVNETPNKNEYSHVHDALQYLILGAGGIDAVLNKSKREGRKGPQPYRSWERGVFGDRTSDLPTRNRHASWTKKLLG